MYCQSLNNSNEFVNIYLFRCLVGWFNDDDQINILTNYHHYHHHHYHHHHPHPGFQSILTGNGDDKRWKIAMMRPITLWEPHHHSEQHPSAKEKKTNEKSWKRKATTTGQNINENRKVNKEWKREWGKKRKVRESEYIEDWGKMTKSKSESWWWWCCCWLLLYTNDLIRVRVIHWWLW